MCFHSSKWNLLVISEHFCEKSSDHSLRNGFIISKFSEVTPILHLLLNEGGSWLKLQQNKNLSFLFMHYSQRQNRAIYFPLKLKALRIVYLCW